MTTVREAMSRPSYNHEPRPTCPHKPTRVNALRFDRLALQAGAVVEPVDPPTVVMADGARYELEQVPA